MVRTRKQQPVGPKRDKTNNKRRRRKPKGRQTKPSNNSSTKPGRGTDVLKSAAKAAGAGLFDKAWEWLSSEAELLFGDLPEVAEIAMEFLPELLLFLV